MRDVQLRVLKIIFSDPLSLLHLMEPLFTYVNVWMFARISMHLLTNKDHTWSCPPKIEPTHIGLHAIGHNIHRALAKQDCLSAFLPLCQKIFGPWYDFLHPTCWSQNCFDKIWQNKRKKSWSWPNRPFWTHKPVTVWSVLSQHVTACDSYPVSEKKSSLSPRLPRLGWSWDQLHGTVSPQLHMDRKATPRQCRIVGKYINILPCGNQEVLHGFAKMTDRKSVV